MYSVKDSAKYIAELLKRKGIQGEAAREFLVKAWGC